MLTCGVVGAYPTQETRSARRPTRHSTLTTPTETSRRFLCRCLPPTCLCVVDSIDGSCSRTQACLRSWILTHSSLSFTISRWAYRCCTHCWLIQSARARISNIWQRESSRDNHGGFTRSASTIAVVYCVHMCCHVFRCALALVERPIMNSLPNAMLVLQVHDVVPKARGAKGDHRRVRAGHICVF
jgi:hypothetical protein